MILILTQCFPPDIGGIQAIMAGLAQTASEKGHAVTVLADAAAGAKAYDAAAGFDVVRYGGIKPLRRFLKGRAAQRIISDRKPRVIFCDSWKSLEHVSATDVPIVVIAHGMEYSHQPSERKKARITGALSKATAVVGDSRYAVSRARPYISAATRVSVVNPAIAPMPDAKEAAAALRERYGPPTLVGLGRLEPRKGFDRVIEALPDVAKRNPGVSFLIGGAGDDQGRLLELAERMGVASRVHLLGGVVGERKAALLSAADLFVMPTRRVGNSVEGFGIVYAEAAWYGVPALAGIEGGAGDFVEDGKTGRLVDGSQPVADVLLDMLSDAERLKSMGRAAQSKVKSSGLWEHAFVRYMEAAGPRP